MYYEAISEHYSAFTSNQFDQSLRRYEDEIRTLMGTRVFKTPHLQNPK